MGPLTESWVFITLEILAAVFILAIGIGVICFVVMYITDITQTQQTIRRNYPVVGRFRYFFEHMGEFSSVLLRYGSRRTSI